MNSKLYRWRHALTAGLLLGALLGAGCGGSEQAETFRATRVIALGDESSVIDDFNRDANGRKYSVDATVSATSTTLDCRLNPLWIQVLATRYGLVFPQCNPAPNAVVQPVSRIRANAGARSVDLAGQLAAQLAESALKAGDLVTVLVGQNDVLDQYARFPGVAEPQLIAEVEAAGARVGAVVNQMAGTGAKVLVSTIPNFGYTPFGTAQRVANPTGIDRAELLSRLSQRFNASLRSSILNDGRVIGLVLADEYFGTVVGAAGGNDFTNVVNGVCDLTKSTLTPPSILDCTTRTLVSGGSGDQWLWADSYHLSAGGQRSLGSVAVGRATTNPF